MTFATMTCEYESLVNREPWTMQEVWMDHVREQLQKYEVKL